MKKLNVLMAIFLGVGSMSPVIAAETRANKVASSKTIQTKIDLNSADEQTLQKVPGIGPKKAAAIVSYRNQHGKFKQLSDLLAIPQKGINTKWLEKIKDYVICSNK